MTRGAAGVLILSLAALPFAAARYGHRGAFDATLQMGPGDSPFLRGFAPEFEIEEGQGTHWTGLEGVVDLPLRASGPARLHYRLARVLPQTAHVDVLLGGRVVDRFTCRGGRLVDGTVDLGPLGDTPLTVAFHVEGRDDRQLGLKLHSLGIFGEGSLALRGVRAQGAGSLLIFSVAAFLAVAGFSLLETALLAAPLSVGVAALLLGDPFLTLRLLRLLPGTVLLCGIPLALLARRWASLGRISWGDLRLGSLCAAGAFLGRATLLNRPDFYYPDFMLHARLVQVVRAAGWHFLVSPARTLWAPAHSGGGSDGLVRSASGLWMRALNGVPLGMPYSLAFHVPFALLPLGYDQILTVTRIAACLLTAATVVFALAFARRSGISAWGAGLMVFVPSYLEKLSVGALPAVFGHAVDVAFLAWLAGKKPIPLVAGTLLVAACDLAYVSAIIHIGVFLVVWASVRALGARNLRPALPPLAIGVGGGILALLIYYRDFLPAVSMLVRGAGGGAGSGYAPEAFLPLLATRTLSFFGWGYPLLAVAGLGLLLTRGGAGLLLPWGITYVLLIFMRSEVPLVFRWVHDTLFVTPFLCLAAGAVLGELWERGSRGLAAALFVAFALQGAVLGWLAVAQGLGRVL